MDEKLQLTIDTLQDVKISDIVVFDMRKTSPFFDYVVLSSVNNPRQLKAGMARLKKAFDEKGHTPFKSEGGPEAKWILLDGGDLIVNIFTREERAYYNIEKMWHDVPRIEIENIE